MPKVPFWVFIIIALLYFTAARVDVMDIDASQYAEISREMLRSGDYLHVMDRGIDYLDKPPFLFWMCASSMHLFGVNNFGYKFPSLLFGLWAIFATYKLAKRLYGEETGRVAALIFATCQGMMLWTNDVRCDTILTSCVITAIWLINEWTVNRKLWYLLGGSAAIACGMMTKGPIALMVPVFAFIADWALKRQWRNFFRPEYLLALVVIGILLVPMCIGLYTQFDLHPEKMVNGRQHTSGLRFFFWSQSFGRITGENPWKNEVDLGFLLQNMLWSYLPWIFLLLPAIVLDIVRLFRQKLKLQPGQEWISAGGFLLTYLALGSSSYQLPHYIFVAFPFAAIINAKWVALLISEKKYFRFYKFMAPFQTVITGLILMVTLVLIIIVFPARPWVIALWALGFMAWLWFVFRRSLQDKMVYISSFGMIIANAFLTNQVYTNLLTYQVGSQVGPYIAKHCTDSMVVAYSMDDPLNCVHFYARKMVNRVDSVVPPSHGLYVLTMEKGLANLSARGCTYDTLKEGSFFKVSELTPEFLNPATRPHALKNYYLVRIR